MADERLNFHVEYSNERAKSGREYPEFSSIDDQDGISGGVWMVWRQMQNEKKKKNGYLGLTPTHLGEGYPLASYSVTYTRVFGKALWQ